MAESWCECDAVESSADGDEESCWMSEGANWRRNGDYRSKYLVLHCLSRKIELTCTEVAGSLGRMTCSSGCC